MDNTFLEAAMLVDTGIGYSIPSPSHYHACTAIERTITGGCFGDRKYLLAFRKYFKPKHKTVGSAWFGEAMQWNMGTATREGPAILLKNKEDRVMALLFMHEIAKDLPEFNKTT